MVRDGGARTAVREQSFQKQMVRMHEPVISKLSPLNIVREITFGSKHLKDYFIGQNFNPQNNPLLFLQTGQLVLIPSLQKL